MAKIDFEQKLSSKNNNHVTGGKPDAKIRFSVDIPDKGIHKQGSYSSDDEHPRKRDGKYREYDKKNYVSFLNGLSKKKENPLPKPVSKGFSL